MLVKFCELECGDLIKASWLGTYKGSEWHTVYDIYPSSDNKLKISIEGFGTREFNKYDTVEKQ